MHNFCGKIDIIGIRDGRKRQMGTKFFIIPDRDNKNITVRFHFM